MNKEEQKRAQWFRLVLARYQHAIALDYVIPFRVIKPEEVERPDDDRRTDPV